MPHEDTKEDEQDGKVCEKQNDKKYKIMEHLNALVDLILGKKT